MNTEKVMATCLGILTVIVVGAVLKFAQAAMIPLAIAIILFFVFTPLLALMEKFRIHRIIAITVVIVIFFGFFYLFGLFIYASVKSFIIQLPKYQARFTTLLIEVSRELFERFDVSPTVLAEINWGRTLQNSLLSVSGSLMSLLGNLVMITLFLIFLLLEQNRFQIKVRKAFHISMSDRIYFIMKHINEQIGRYLSIKFIISLATGILIYLSLTIVGLDFPIIWGSLAFFLNFIPNIGSSFMVIVIIIMSFLQFYPDMRPILLVSTSVIAIQVTLGNIIDPRLQGRRLNLSPFLILVSLLVWGWLWGIVGMFLAVPIMAIIKIICENIPALRSIAILMGSGQEVRNPPETAQVMLNSPQSK
ncbi:AI-2E family transporter [Marispirochaeta sp.]|uniref:AI-2E family transporter n=1 Tax=Marispirochaeta sp. TaxID=2038653 RepID=UPI0029C6AE60|nr:AI-2E family transporter [Marispirochaeta sp.]